MNKQPTYDVFLSHNSTDKPVVEELARRLVKEGIDPWLDKWNLIPGDPWQEAIEDALNQCVVCAVFIGPSGSGPWQNEEMRAAIDRRVCERKGFRVIPVLLPGAERGERSRLPNFLLATTWVEFRHTIDDEFVFHRLVCGIRGKMPGPGPGEAVCEGQCPYRGLQVFEVEHAPFFFGREALTEWLLDALRFPTSKAVVSHFLAIIGPSGSGKSSLARAGLAAALKRGEIEGSADWPLVICRPGSDPLESLSVALSGVTRAGQNPSAVRELMTAMRDDERMLHLTTRLALQNAPLDHRFVILIDQFEEVFTLCSDETDRQAFINNLLYASSVVDGKTFIILTLRADFYGECALYPNLATALSDHQVLVGSMTDAELQQAVERPAHLAGCEFEAGLVELLLQEIQHQPGYLPLLQHTLLELWNRRQGRKFTLAAYESIGGVRGALERRAEKIYSRFTKTEQQICQRIFLRLTQPGEGTEDTKRRTSLQELLPVENKDNAVENVLNTLAAPDVRLITLEGGQKLTQGEQFVEVAHEALIRGWLRLRKWIDENRDALQTHRRITEAADEWDEQQHEPSYLYQGKRLNEAIEWAEQYGYTQLSQQEHRFLKTSLRRRRWQRFEMVAGIVLIPLLMVFIAIFIAANAKWDILRRLNSWQSSAQWERETNGVGLYATVIAADPTSPERVWAADRSKGGLYRSVDGGQH